MFTKKLTRDIADRYRLIEKFLIAHILRNVSTINNARIKESILIFWLGCRIGNRGFVICFPAGSRGRSFLPMVKTGSRAHSAFYSVGVKSSSPGDKRPWSDASHSPPSSADVKNNWSCTSTTPYAFMACKRQIYLSYRGKKQNLYCWQVKSLVWILMLPKLSIISCLVSRMQEKMATWR